MHPVMDGSCYTRLTLISEAILKGDVSHRVSGLVVFTGTGFNQLKLLRLLNSFKTQI